MNVVEAGGERPGQALRQQWALRDSRSRFPAVTWLRRRSERCGQMDALLNLAVGLSPRIAGRVAVLGGPPLPAPSLPWTGLGSSPRDIPLYGNCRRRHAAT